MAQVLVTRWLRCLHCCLTARRSWVQFPHGVLLALGGRSPPDLQRYLPRRSVLSPRPFCVEFACSPRVHKGFPPLRTLTEKTCKKNRTLLSVPDRDGRLQAAHCSWEVLTATSGLRVCVCVCVMCVCVCECVCV